MSLPRRAPSPRAQADSAADFEMLGDYEEVEETHTHPLASPGLARARAASFAMTAANATVSAATAKAAVIGGGVVDAADEGDEGDDVDYDEGEDDDDAQYVGMDDGEDDYGQEYD